MQDCITIDTIPDADPGHGLISIEQVSIFFNFQVQGKSLLGSVLFRYRVMFCFDEQPPGWL